jgi:hypothetical protein
VTTGPTYPETPEDVTADSLARYMAVAGWDAWTRWTATPEADRTSTGRKIRDLTLLAAVDGYAITRLLRALADIAPERADDVARDLWEAWDAGSAIGEELHDWLREYGIDTNPGQVAA